MVQTVDKVQVLLAQVESAAEVLEAQEQELLELLTLEAAVAVVETMAVKPQVRLVALV